MRLGYPAIMASQAPAVTEDLKAQFLEGLAPGDLKSILGAAAKMRFPANSVVVNQGEPARRMFLLAEGGARFFYLSPEGHKLIGPRILPGDIFGGAAILLKPCSYLASTETVKDSRVLAWDRNTIRALAGRYPRLMDNSLCLAFDYLDWAILAHIGLACHSARVRLAQTLADLTRAVGHKNFGGVELHVTNEELADAANVTVFTASRLLSEWHRDGAVVKSRGKVQLRHPERLFSRGA
jgi:CRP/FNR family transcriptional regulator, nitrogen oxide reductase regulator